MCLDDKDIIGYYLTAEEIERLIDGEYYWIAYEFPNADDEIWDIGKYNKKFNQFDLCSRITITPKYIIEVQKVEPAH
jgi:hypothetical protein